MPIDQLFEPISDHKVLPILPAGKSSFGVDAQLKNAMSRKEFAL